VPLPLQEGITTGISAAERTATVRALADSASVPGTFVHPGHIFPLRYREGGVLRRAGHTEAAVDLSRLAGCAPVGVLCEVRSCASRCGHPCRHMRATRAHAARAAALTPRCAALPRL
jgi:3,4-dihydroxy-2-butanone 4-phosphate synthase